MVMQTLIFVLLLVLIWLGLITFYLQKLIRNYTILTEGSNKKTLDAVLNNIVKDLNDAKKDIVKLRDQYDTIEKNGQYHIQKIGLLRFNPFKDTGGDQSFILSLTDAHETGVVITALYSRSGTRWYAKNVVQGKGSEHQLSEEEKKTLTSAKSINQLS
jgi:hypothetical protein